MNTGNGTFLADEGAYFIFDVLIYLTQIDVEVGQARCRIILPDLQSHQDSAFIDLGDILCAGAKDPATDPGH